MGSLPSWLLAAEHTFTMRLGDLQSDPPALANVSLLYSSVGTDIGNDSLLYFINN